MSCVCVSRLPVQLVSGNSFETPTEAEQSRAARVAIERCVSYKNNHRAGRTEAEEEKRRAQTSPWFIQFVLYHCVSATAPGLVYVARLRPDSTTFYSFRPGQRHVLRPISWLFPVCRDWRFDSISVCVCGTTCVQESTYPTDVEKKMDTITLSSCAQVVYVAVTGWVNESSEVKHKGTWFLSDWYSSSLKLRWLVKITRKLLSRGFTMDFIKAIVEQRIQWILIQRTGFFSLSLNYILLWFLTFY